ncbi:MAG: ribosomal RNA small subunit methyltransferase A [Thermoplasmata archaeon]|nr:MAG: ribosomal RNA small subunit methyltransferase A [Thermoplasmata archaeon]KAA0012317.1 MAG: ribosomal RNA small subunit methyltransferase A [Thermoplasmata archaeon]
MRKWGQHFLVDSCIAQKEVVYADISHNDTVLEIGPGKGILTKLIAERAKKVIAIEIDRKLAEYLRTILPMNVEIINADVMKLDLSEYQFNKVVSNLPFEISSPVTFKLLEESSFSKAVLIYQKEFARRLVAKPNSKDYSRISVVIDYKAKVRILDTVPRDAFRPVPKVDGAIVEIIPRDKPAFHVDDENFFYEFLKKCFSYRRKTIGAIIRKEYGIHLDEEFYRKRIEQLYPREIGELCNLVFERITSNR